MTTSKKIRTLLAVGLTLLALVRPCLAEIPLSWSTEELYQQAENLYRQGEYRKALEYALGDLDKNPDDWRGFRLAGYASYKLGDLASTEDYCRKSLLLHPENEPLRTFLGRISPQVDPPSKLPEGLRNPASFPSTDHPTPRASHGTFSDEDRVVVGVTVGVLAVVACLVILSDELSNLRVSVW